MTMHLTRAPDIFHELVRGCHFELYDKIPGRCLNITYIRINNLSIDRGKVYLKDGTKTRYIAYLEPHGVHEMPMFAPSKEHCILQICDSLYADSEIEGTINIVGYYY